MNDIRTDEEIFEDVFKSKCKSIPPECVRWIDSLCGIRALDSDGVLPNVIDIQSASKSDLARFADLCKRLEKMFADLSDVAKSNRSLACKQIGKQLAEDEEGNFDLTDKKGVVKSKFKRSEEFFVAVKDETKLLGWLFINGFAETIKHYYIHPKTLNSILKEHLKSGGVLPSDKVVKCHPDTTAKVTQVNDVEGVWDGDIQIQKPTEVEIGKESASLDVKESDVTIE